MPAAHLIETYTDRDGAEITAKEWRDSARVERVRIVERQVRAFGTSRTVFVVAVWWTQAAIAMGWNK